MMSAARGPLGQILLEEDGQPGLTLQVPSVTDFVKSERTMR